MTAATPLALVLGAIVGLIVGGMILDSYHERLRQIYAATATDAEAKRHATAGELAAVRQQFARSEAMVDAMSREIAILKAQRSQAEAQHAERIRRTLTEAARWN